MLLDAINELRQVVLALKKVLEEDYPKRAEIAQKYATKTETYYARTVFIRRLRQSVGLVVLALLLSYFATISTVSVCFLQPDSSPAPCKIIPGYTSSRELNDQIINEFKRLQEITQRNDRRLDRLERDQ